MRSPEDRLPTAPWGDHVLTVLLIVAAGAFVLMLVWLVAR